MAKCYYCPVCGTINTIPQKTCMLCDSSVRNRVAKYDRNNYQDKARRYYGDPEQWQRVLTQQEIKRNPEYNARKAEFVKFKVNKENTAAQQNEMDMPPKRVEKENTPKCPTCNSTNIKRISGMKRAFHGYAFGIFSKTAFSQFECENCGYKW